MPASSEQKVTIRPALFPADKEIVTSLFLAYAKSLPIALDFQNFDTELAELPGKYAAENGGAVYLACVPATAAAPASALLPKETTPEDEASTCSNPAASPSPLQEHVLGCVGLRALSPPDKCELKRLYLAPESRGLGISRLLMDAVIQRARQLGYTAMLLDSLKSMTAAKTLYLRYGFVEVEAYYPSVEDATFHQLTL